MAPDILLLLLGIALAWLTLRDVFDTVVVPGGSRASLQVTRRVGRILLAIWKSVRRRRTGVTFSFAPLVLVSSFVIWMGLLALAFGLMIYAARAHFQPPVTGFGDAVYEAGSALVTVGLSPHFPAGGGRWIVLGAGFCGLAVMTMAVTYLLEVQNSITRRDIGIIKINTSGGHPPSAITLLERYAAIRHQAGLAEVLDEGRNWCATVRQSHSTHPSLIYFQSVSTGAGWPAALGALLDLALFSEYCLDEPSLRGAAVLLRDEGTRMARELAQVISLKPCDVASDEAELKQAAEQLRSNGYEIRNCDFAIISQQRVQYRSCVEALARHLGKPTAMLVRQD